MAGAHSYHPWISLQASGMSSRALEESSGFETTKEKQAVKETQLQPEESEKEILLVDICEVFFFCLFDCKPISNLLK